MRVNEVLPSKACERRVHSENYSFIVQKNLSLARLLAGKRWRYAIENQQGAGEGF